MRLLSFKNIYLSHLDFIWYKSTKLLYKEEMISPLFELENLMTATGFVRSQIHRWRNAKLLSKDIKEYAERLSKAET